MLRRLSGRPCQLLCITLGPCAGSAPAEEAPARQGSSGGPFDFLHMLGVLGRAGSEAAPPVAKPLPGGSVASTPTSRQVGVQSRILHFELQHSLRQSAS